MSISEIFIAEYLHKMHINIGSHTISPKNMSYYDDI